MLGHSFYIHDEFKSAIVISAVIIVCHLVFTGTREIFTYKSEIQMLELRNGFILESYQSREAHMNQVAKIEHDMRKHLIAIKILLDDGKYEQLGKYLADVRNDYPEPSELVYCGHHMIQSILGHYANRVRNMGFVIGFEISPLPPMIITDKDTVVLFMNLLDNAVESCEKIGQADKRWIKVTVKCHEQFYLYVCVKNALSKKVVQENGKYASTKRDTVSHGHGLSIVRDIAEKYQGFSDFEHTDNSFCAKAVLRVIDGEREDGKS